MAEVRRPAEDYSAPASWGPAEGGVGKDVSRTPDERFAGLPDFPYPPRYLEGLPGYSGLRMHYVDEGPAEAKEVFLCLHGQPTWSYLYRRMMPVFLAAGHRVVAVDFFGFGRSDKPRDEGVYTFDFHRGSLHALVERLDLRGITLVCQDWGGTLGLTLPMEMPGRFCRLLVMNTVLGVGDRPLPEGFLPWRVWVRGQPDLKVGRLVGRACRHLTPQEQAAYDAPFPDAGYKAGVRRFPCLMPALPGDPGAALGRRARAWLREEWEGETFMAVGERDPVIGSAAMEELRRSLRGCPEPLLLQTAGHYVPEWGCEVAHRALAAFGLEASGSPRS